MNGVVAVVYIFHNNFIFNLLQILVKVILKIQVWLGYGKESPGALAIMAHWVGVLAP